MLDGSPVLDRKGTIYTHGQFFPEQINQTCMSVEEHMPEQQQLSEFAEKNGLDPTGNQTLHASKVEELNGAKLRLSLLLKVSYDAHF